MKLSASLRGSLSTIYRSALSVPLFVVVGTMVLLMLALVLLPISVIVTGIIVRNLLARM